MNIAHVLHRTALARPHAPALHHGARCVKDYAQLRADVLSIAASLQAQGIGADDRVALFMRNHVRYLECLMAALWIGATVVPVNFKLHPRELDYILGDSGAKLLMSCSEGGRVLKGGTLSWRGMGINIDVKAHRAQAGEALAQPVAREPDAAAWLFYTSGTTGRSKGVVITHRNLLAMTLAYFVNVDAITDEDAMLYAAPMSHGAGLYAFPALLAGARHVVPESGAFVAAEIIDLARSIGRLCLFAAPTMVRRLVDAAEAAPDAIAGIKLVIYGGGPMYAADIRRALAVMGGRFAQIYGQGESPMTITALSRADLLDTGHPNYDARLVSVGRAQAPVEVAVLGPDGSHQPPGTPGEVAVRGETVMREYWNQPEATRQALKNGWLHTGDIGSLASDGYLTLLDRSKDMIVSGGSNIYPREVEEVLLTSTEVAEACVIGVPDAEWGEIVVAYVVAAPGAVPNADALDHLCIESIARFKRPKQYRFVETLPKNHYGKVLKTELRAQYAREHAAQEGGHEANRD